LPPLNAVLKEAFKELQEKDRVREELIRLSRDIGRLVRSSINLVHQGKEKDAHKLLNEAKELLDRIRNIAINYPDLMYSGLLFMVYQEFAEAMIFSSIVSSQDIPSHKELGIPVAPYLNGVADVIGELRRMILDKIRIDKLDEAIKLFKIMEDLYLALREFDFPDALTPGLRRRCDIARHVVESTRTELLNATLNKRLHDLMVRLLESLKEKV